MIVISMEITLEEFFKFLVKFLVKVLFEEIETSKIPYTLAYLRFIAIAAKIKDEVARKNILAPYRPHVIQ